MSTTELSDEHRNFTIFRRPWTLRRTQENCGSSFNNVIRKRSHSGSIIPYITVDGIKISNPSDIANNFGNFYSTLGESLAQNIPKSKVSVNDYLAKIP